MLLGVERQRAPAVGQRAAQADRAQHVEQRLARAPVHPHVAAGYQRQRAARGDRAQPLQPGRVVERAGLLDADPAAPGPALPQPLRERVQRSVVGAALRHGQHEAAVERGGVGLVGAQRGAALARAGAAAQPADELAQVAVAVAVAGQRDQRVRRAVRIGSDLELAADDQLQALRLGRLVGAHDAAERALVGQRQRAVAELAGALDELLGPARAVQERVRRQAAQLGIVGRGWRRAARGQLRAVWRCTQPKLTHGRAPATAKVRTRRPALRYPLAPSTTCIAPATNRACA